MGIVSIEAMISWNVRFSIFNIMKSLPEISNQYLINNNYLKPNLIQNSEFYIFSHS